MRLPRRAWLLVLYGAVGGCLWACESLRAFSEHGVQIGLGTGLGALGGFLVAGPLGAVAAAGIASVTVILATPPPGPPPPATVGSTIANWIFWVLLAGGLVIYLQLRGRHNFKSLKPFAAITHNLFGGRLGLGDGFAGLRRKLSARRPSRPL